MIKGNGSGSIRSASRLTPRHVSICSLTQAWSEGPIAQGVWA
jgi:hypothetical protein